MIMTTVSKKSKKIVKYIFTFILGLLIGLIWLFFSTGYTFDSAWDEGYDSGVRVNTYHILKNCIVYDSLKFNEGKSKVITNEELNDLILYPEMILNRSSKTYNSIKDEEKVSFLFSLDECYRLVLNEIYFEDIKSILTFVESNLTEP